MRYNRLLLIAKKRENFGVKKQGRKYFLFMSLLSLCLLCEPFIDPLVIPHAKDEELVHSMTWSQVAGRFDWSYMHGLCQNIHSAVNTCKYV